MKLSEVIRDILTQESGSFESGLYSIDKHFFNVKQELQIRDLLVNCINDRVDKDGYIALAEFPRKDGLRRDIGVFDLSEMGGGPEDAKYTIELKFNYFDDIFLRKTTFKTRENSVVKALQYDSEEKSFGDYPTCDLFVLILCFRPWANKPEFKNRVVVPERDVFDQIPNEAMYQSIKKSLEELFRSRKTHSYKTVSCSNYGRDTSYLIGVFSK